MIQFSFKKKLHAANGLMQLDVTCNIGDGELVGLYGASGAGKTSILRMLAGFLRPAEGFIKVNSEVWYNSAEKINVSPQKRSTGFVFQDYALFPNMNVRQNLEFALQKGEAKTIINELLELTQLGELRDKKIQSLSGGQKQRIALARALVRKPALLLLDEPLSAIDTEMREKLQDTILQIHRLYGLTTILVSHDIPEIIKLCDKTISLEHGLITTYKPPVELFFNRPAAGGFDMEGNIINIEEDGDSRILAVLVGNQVIHIKQTGGDITSVQKGDKIKLTAANFAPAIKKI